LTKGNPRIDIVLAGFFGGLAVYAGANAAHGMTDPQAIGWLKTASQYAAVHGVALLALAALERTGFQLVRGTRVLFAVGVCLFSGALVALAYGAPRWMGIVAPVGGVALMIGWLLVLFAGVRNHTAE
jgi:uncharacterized membrane protein YgdD (TMEM256/DUF423 family)